jgi:parallel beta-helix repeat protein
MPVKQSGQGEYVGTVLRDPKAHFKHNQVRPGDIVRAGKTFAVVAEIQSENSLRVEEWLMDTDRSPSNPPEPNTPYTTYGILLGEVRSFTSNSLNTTRWWDFDGRTVTPAPGMRYEVLTQRPNYALHAEAGTRDLTVSNNHFRRGWSDQISMWGDRAVVKNNVIEHGEDMGITLHGKKHRISNNRIVHQGAGGIYLTGDDSVIENNRITDSQWVNEANKLSLGDIMVDDGNRNIIIRNWCERVSSVLSFHGIVISARHRGSDANRVIQNVSRNHLKADIRFHTQPGARVTETKLEKNQGTLVR